MWERQWKMQWFCNTWMETAHSLTLPRLRVLWQVIDQRHWERCTEAPPGDLWTTLVTWQAVAVAGSWTEILAVPALLLHHPGSGSGYRRSNKYIKLLQPSFAWLGYLWLLHIKIKSLLNGLIDCNKYQSMKLKLSLFQADFYAQKNSSTSSTMNSIQLIKRIELNSTNSTNLCIWNTTT